MGEKNRTTCSYRIPTTETCQRVEALIPCSACHDRSLSSCLNMSLEFITPTVTQSARSGHGTRCLVHLYLDADVCPSSLFPIKRSGQQDASIHSLCCLLQAWPRYLNPYSSRSRPPSVSLWGLCYRRQTLQFAGTLLGAGLCEAWAECGHMGYRTHGSDHSAFLGVGWSLGDERMGYRSGSSLFPHRTLTLDFWSPLPHTCDLPCHKTGPAHSTMGLLGKPRPFPQRSGFTKSPLKTDFFFYPWPWSML